MSMIVFHLKPKDSNAYVDCRMVENARLYWSQQPEGRLAHYVAVATVDADGLARVFERTNHIDQPWQENYDVRPLRPGVSERSTSVGDVVLDAKRGVLWFCAPYGWEQMEILKGAVPTAA